MLLLFLNHAFFKLTFCHGKRDVSCKIAMFTQIYFSFGQNFIKLHGYIVYLKFHHVFLLFYVRLIQFDALSWKKGVSCEIPILLGSNSVFVKIPWIFIVILFMKGFTNFTCRFIYAKRCYRKRCLMSFTLGFIFVDSKIKRIPVS